MFLLKKLKKFLFLPFVLSLAVTIKAENAFEGLSQEEQAQAAGVYFEEVLKYVENNYIGKDVDTEYLVRAALEGMTSALDEYSGFLPENEYIAMKEEEKKDYYSPDFTCTFDENGYPVINKIQENSENYKSGIRQGDLVRSINGVSAYGIQEEEYTERTKVDISGNINMILYRPSTKATTDYKLFLKKIKSNTVVVKDIAEFNTKRQVYDNTNVGYIRITAFSKDTSSDFASAIAELQNKKVNSLILDLRGNTGGYVDEAIEVAKQIVPAGVIITTTDKAGNNTVYTSTLNRQPFEHCVILVDSLTASASEILASAMQDSGAAEIVGEKTFGKGIMQSVTEFQGLGVIKMTTLEYRSRNGSTINQIGITPDVIVNKILFVDEKDDITSEKVTTALSYIGFKNDGENTNERNIGKYQAELGLPVTYKLDQKTVNALNLEIYSNLLEDDRILTAGYINLGK